MNLGQLLGYILQNSIYVCIYYMHTYVEFCRTCIDNIRMKNEMSIATSLVSTYTITFLLTRIGATCLIKLGLEIVFKVGELKSKFFRLRASGTIDIV